MNNLIRFYNQNRRKIFRIIIIIIFLFLLLQLCNFLAKEKGNVDNENASKNSKKIEQEIKQNPESNTKLIVESVKKIILSKKS